MIREFIPLIYDRDLKYTLYIYWKRKIKRQLFNIKTVGYIEPEAFSYSHYLSKNSTMRIHRVAFVYFRSQDLWNICF